MNRDTKDMLYFSAGVLTFGVLATALTVWLSMLYPSQYDNMHGVVTNIEVGGVTSNAWSGTSGNCRITLLTNEGQSTISPYWRDCYKVSVGDQINSYRRSNRNNPADIPGRWQIDTR